MQQNASKTNGHARYCGKIKGRNKKFLFLYSFGLLTCSLARQQLGIEKNCSYMLDHLVSMATLSLTS